VVAAVEVELEKMAEAAVEPVVIELHLVVVVLIK
jgi:hypothetical protein